MNRLGKILTLGLERKRAWQLPIITALLVLFGLGVRWWFNSRAARTLSLVKLVEIGDIDGVRYVCKWDSGQVNEEGEVSEALKDKKELFTYKSFPLFLAVELGHTEIVKVLIEAEVEVNPKIQPGWFVGSTSLHYAAWLGNTEVATILLKAGAKVNAKDKDGETPLDVTKLRDKWIDPKKQDECGKFLRAHGAKTGAELDAKGEPGK